MCHEWFEKYRLIVDDNLKTICYAIILLGR